MKDEKKSQVAKKKKQIVQIPQDVCVALFKTKEAKVLNIEPGIIGAFKANQTVGF